MNKAQARFVTRVALIDGDSQPPPGFTVVCRLMPEVVESFLQGFRFGI
jgi:hypothetical protein